MSARLVETEIAWWDATTWVKNAWYPMPVGFMERDQKEYIIDGWMIFKAARSTRKEAASGDIDCLPIDTMTFSQAIKICERHNGFVLIP